MPALNFQNQFAGPVASRRKRQTIRANRARPFREGDTLYLYTGMRTKACRKLGEATARMVREITITETAVKLDGQAISPAALGELARADGFRSVSEFRDFFRSNHGLPFRGQLIQWGEV